MLQETRTTERQFIGDHLVRFGTAFAIMLEGADAGGFHRAPDILLRALLEAECERLGIAPWVWRRCRCV